MMMMMMLVLLQQMLSPLIHSLASLLHHRAVRILIASLPAVKQISMEVLEVVFVPKAIAKQLVLAVALQTGAVTIKQIMSLSRSLLSNFSSRSRLIRQLQAQQGTSDSQDEWMDLAERIDNIQGNDLWRSDPYCALYERERISARIDEFVHLMRRRDNFELMFTLRGGIARNRFGLLHEGLFSKALAGSKVLVETYHNVVCAALDFCCDAPVRPGEEPIPTDARLAFFNETRHSYGRTALLLSGGAALGFYHVGVVKTLMENGLMPRVLGGSSAGSILVAMVATRTDEECIEDLFEAKGTSSPGHSGKLRLNFFRPLGDKEDIDWAKDNSDRENLSDMQRVYHNTAGGFHDAKRTLQAMVPIGIRNLTSAMYDVLTGNRRPQDILNHDTEHFRQCVRANVGDFTFQEAFDRTGRILNITVTPKNSSDPPRLLNYLTAPHVLVWSAAVASSSLPGVFESNKLMVKDADGTERYESADSRFSDGSMEADLPMQQLSEMFNVNHFIVSQANPHAVMFASFGLDSGVWEHPLFGALTGILLFLKNQVRAWMEHLVTFSAGRRIAPLFDTRRGLMSQFFTQEYEGRDCDISLIPWINHRGFFSALLHCIYNPSEKDFRGWIKAAERETWKYIPAIKSHIAEEVTLDRCVQRLRKRLVKESWEKVRQDSTGAKMGNRVPSFFTSPSLVNMQLCMTGGQAVTDRPSRSSDFSDSAQREYDEQVAQGRTMDMGLPLEPLPPVEFNLGWGGMGLRGNHSTGNLHRSASNNSGIFFDADESHAVSAGVQVAGERTATISPKPPSSSDLSGSMGEGRYLKTSSMAHFYYRRAGSNEGAILMPPIRHTQSHDQLEGEGDAANSVHSAHVRKQSKSHVDLGTLQQGAERKLDRAATMRIANTYKNTI
jgi:TAG lipase / steryl ester hydrolase / phospholipase A2 / LPA acyltransferase